jgi:hypothetical protein
VTPPWACDDPARFAAALRRFDEENGRDPNRVPDGDRSAPREEVYARWLTEWVLRLRPDASEALRLAARCQHLCRWLIPRSSYPMTRAGYLRWREALKQFHARRAGEILEEVGYPPGMVKRVQQLNLKSGFTRDPEGQALEDALCLVFLEHQLPELAGKTEEGKVINALEKSWRKMSAAAKAEALKLPYGPREQALVQRVLKSA